MTKLLFFPGMPVFSILLEYSYISIASSGAMDIGILPLSHNIAIVIPQKSG